LPRAPTGQPGHADTRKLAGKHYRRIAMSARAISLLLVAIFLSLFVILNWHALTTPASLSLLVTHVQAPLGLVMLAFAVLLAALFLIYVLYLRTAALLDARQSTRELQVQRQLADATEASRITELRTVVEAGFRSLDERIEQANRGVQAGFEQLSAELRATIEQTGTVLSAYIGEVEDRLERQIGLSKEVPMA
jgi:uncharacterized integral membrane protein